MKGIAYFFQVLLYLFEVVYLAIKNDRVMSEVHRLMASAGKIQDGQAPLSQPDVRSRMPEHFIAGVVGPAVQHHISHALQDICSRFFGKINKPSNSTHVV